MSLFAGAVILGTVFVVYELRTERPMLSVRLFRNAGFPAGSGALAISFMALVGMAFVLT